MDTISTYFNDVFTSFVNRKLSTNLEKYFFITVTGIDVLKYDYAILKYDSQVSKKNIMLIIFGETYPSVYNQGDEIYINITENSIEYFYNEDYKSENPEIIESDMDLFNLKIKHNLTINFEHLKILQSYIPKLKTNHGISFYYSLQEEKQYGY